MRKQECILSLFKKDEKRLYSIMYRGEEIRARRGSCGYIISNTPCHLIIHHHILIMQLNTVGFRLFLIPHTNLQRQCALMFIIYRL